MAWLQGGAMPTTKWLKTMIFLTKKKKNNNNKDVLPAPASNGVVSFDGMQYLRRFSDLALTDADEYGFANAMLGEMSDGMVHRGIHVLSGFVLGRSAFRRYLEANRLTETLVRLLQSLDTSDLRSLSKTAATIQARILRGTMPADVAAELKMAYASLGGGSAQSPLVVRNAPYIDGNVSLISEQSSCLNVTGEARLIQAVQRVFADAFSAKILTHCAKHDLDPVELSVAVSVQEMVYSDRCVSGMMYSVDPQTGYSDIVTIASTYGLGEIINDGVVNPDEFMVYKPALEKGYRPIIKRERGDKSVKRVYTDSTGISSSVIDISVPVAESNRFSLNDDEVLTLALLALEIEQYCSSLVGKACPMEVEWVKDDRTGLFYIIQAAPEPIHFKKRDDVLVEHTLEDRGWILTTGKSVGQAVVTGRARVITDVRQMDRLEEGEILVTDCTSSDWEPVLDRALAIVTDRGGRYSHPVSIAHEMGVPAIIGCGAATENIENGQLITVVCGEQDVGCVFEGEIPYSVTEYTISDLPDISTGLKLNLLNPDRALVYSRLPVDGVGLVGLESIIDNAIGIHPRALLEYEGQAPEIQFEIDDIVAGYADRREYYIEKLAEGVGMIAAAFYPRPVMVRFSDFRSNEYAALFSGETFEDHEENPKIGLRGAARYFSRNFKECFLLECEALRRVRYEMGMNNLNAIVPFVRTLEEGEKVLSLIKSSGLRRGAGGMQIFMMCETPANVLMADEFLELFDGFSIGTDDLTELTVGVDKDCGHFDDVDARNPAVLKMISLAVEASHRHGKPVDICGSAAFHGKDITAWLVERGIDSISCEPRDFLAIHRIVAETERAVFDSDTQEFPASKVFKLHA